MVLLGLGEGGWILLAQGFASSHNIQFDNIFTKRLPGSDFDEFKSSPNVSQATASTAGTGGVAALMDVHILLVCVVLIWLG